MQSAKVFVSIIGTAEQRTVGTIFSAGRPWPSRPNSDMPWCCGYTPHLKFIVDDAIERGDRILQIIDELEHGPGPA